MSASNWKRPFRRRTLGLLSAAAIGAAALIFSSLSWAQSKGALRIGFQKYGTLAILKARGALEKRLAP